MTFDEPSGGYACTSCVPGKYRTESSSGIGCHQCPDDAIAVSPGSASCTSCATPKVANANHTKCVFASPGEVVPFQNKTYSQTEHEITMYFSDFTHHGNLWCQTTFISNIFKYPDMLFKFQDYKMNEANRTHAHIKTHGQMTEILANTTQKYVQFTGLMSGSMYEVACFLKYDDSAGAQHHSLVGYFTYSGGGRYRHPMEDPIMTPFGYPLVIDDSCDRNITNKEILFSVSAFRAGGTAYAYAMEAAADYDVNAPYVGNGSIAFPTNQDITTYGVSIPVSPFSTSMDSWSLPEGVSDHPHEQDDELMSRCIKGYDKTYNITEYPIFNPEGERVREAKDKGWVRGAK